MLEILAAVIVALLGALGIQYARGKSKDLERQKLEKERAIYALQELGRVRRAVESARAKANEEYHLPIDSKTRKDFE
jgi:hypothetical protein